MGGISTVVKGYLNSKITLSYDLIVIPSHIDGAKYKKLFAACRGFFRSMFYLFTQPIDIVHIHSGDLPSPIRKFFYYKLAKFFKSKIIFHLHGALLLREIQDTSRFWKSRLIEMFEGVDVIICLSNSWERDIKALAPRAKTRVVPNGISIENIPQLQKKTQMQIQFTFLGSIGQRKGIFDLIGVFDQVLKSGYNAFLNIGGNGEVSRMHQEITSRGLERSIRYLGWVTGQKKVDLLKRTDVYVLPSYGEGMPMSVIEAMAYGTPVISTCVGGIPELVEDKTTGFLFNPGDLNALKNRIEYLIDNVELREEMGRRARERVLQNHDLSMLTDKINDIYRFLLDG